MARAMRNCRNCGVEIKYNPQGPVWEDANNSTKCEGFPRGHQPPNTVKSGKSRYAHGGK